MSITPLSAARIAGEVGLGIGTVTGGAYAVQYSGELSDIKNTSKDVKDDAIEALQTWYSLNWYLNKDHPSVIGGIKETEGENKKSLLDRINMYNGCISQYLKGQRSWTEEKDLTYKVNNQDKEEKNTSCKVLLGQIEKLLLQKYPDSKYK